MRPPNQRQAQIDAEWIRRAIAAVSRPGRTTATTGGTFHGGRGIEGRANAVHLTTHGDDLSSQYVLGLFGMTSGDDQVYGP